jgi:hypothetical protein
MDVWDMYAIIRNAIQHGCNPIVKQILRKLPELLKGGNPPIFITVIVSKNMDLIKHICEKYYFQDLYEERSSLHCAIRTGDICIVDYLLSIGADPFILDNYDNYAKNGGRSSEREFSLMKHMPLLFTAVGTSVEMLSHIWKKFGDRIDVRAVLTRNYLIVNCFSSRFKPG